MSNPANRPEPMAATRSSRPSSGKGVLWTIALVLVIIGGINWGLVGLLGFDLVAALFGDMSPLSRIIYVLVGIGAVISVFALPRLARAS